MALLTVYYDPGCSLCGRYLTTIREESGSHEVRLCSIDDDPFEIVNALIEARLSGHDVQHLPLLRLESGGALPVYYDGILEDETIRYILMSYE
jgi:hypothetical protein